MGDFECAGCAPLTGTPSAHLIICPNQKFFDSNVDEAIHGVRTFPSMFNDKRNRKNWKAEKSSLQD